MYKVRLETFNGDTRVIELPSRGAVAQFINEYPSKLPTGISVKIAVDALGIVGTLRGVA